MSSSNFGEKKTDASIADILDFRKQLSQMVRASVL